VRVAIFLCTKRIFKKPSGPPELARCASLNLHVNSFFWKCDLSLPSNCFRCLWSIKPQRYMKRNERARVTLTLTPWLGVWFACSLSSAFSGLACSACLDPGACSLNARGARSPTNSTLFISRVSRFTANSLWGGKGALAPPAPKRIRSKKIDLRNKHGAVGGRCVHVGKIKCRDQDRTERARDQAKRRAERER
jgi:hypothetical protein